MDEIIEKLESINPMNTVLVDKEELVTELRVRFPMRNIRYMTLTGMLTCRVDPKDLARTCIVISKGKRCKELYKKYTTCVCY